MDAAQPIAPTQAPPSAPSQSRLRRAHQSVAALFFICGFGFSNWSSRIPSVRESFGLSDRDLGLLLLCTGLGSMVSFRLAGSLTHRYGSRALAFGGTAGFSVLLNAAPAMPGPIAAGVALLFLGFAAGFMDVCMNTQAVEVERDMGRAILSTLHGVCSLGALAGAATGTAAAYLGLGLSLHMLIVTVPMLAAVLWARQGLLPPSRMPASLRPRAKPGRASGTLLLLGAIGFCSSVGEGAMSSWVGVYLHDDLHMEMGAAALGFACFSFTMVLGRLTCDRLAGKMHPRQLVRASGVLVTVGLALGLTINTPWAIMAAALAVGLGLAPIIPAIFRTGGRLKDIPPSDALATLATMSYGGGLFGPPTIGLVADNAGLRIGLGVVALLALVLTVLAQWMPRPELQPMVSAK